MSISLTLVSGNNHKLTYHVTGKGVSGKITWDRTQRTLSGSTHTSETLAEICNQLASMVQKNIDSLMKKHGSSDPEINVLIRSGLDEVKSLKTLSEIRKGGLISFLH